MKRLERFDPIAVLDKVNELVDSMNALKAPPEITTPDKVKAHQSITKVSLGPQQVSVTEKTELAPKAPETPATAWNSASRVEAALNVAINRLIELKDTATVERVNRIWRRA